MESAFDHISRTAEAPASLSLVREEEEERRRRTWRDIPEDELAERLSKGEVIGRDEWVPGLSEGRRKLNAESLMGHLGFGKRIHAEGNEAYEKKDFELALTRYTQVSHEGGN